MSKKINNSFKELYIWCKQETKEKIKDIIIKKLNFYDYFSFLDEYLNYLVNMIIDIKLDNKYYILIIFFILEKKLNKIIL